MWFVWHGDLWQNKAMDVQTNSTLSKLRESLQSIYGPRLSHMILYGSHARGEATRDSDIDVLVVLKGPVQPGAEIARTSDTVAALSLQTDNVITCLFMDEERYLHRAGPLLRNIRREGVTVL
jgi:predicted nucleotidyltransferase